MRWRVHEIQDLKVLDATAALKPAEVTLDSPDNPRIVSPIQARIHAEVDGDGIEVQVNADTRVELACARCVEKFSVPLSVQFQSRTPLTETYVDVRDDLRQNLLLGLPMKPLCRPDCRGLCSKCGKNLNQGTCECHSKGKPSPFDVLKSLKLKKK